MLIVPFQTEAKNLFGVLCMERLMAAAEHGKVSFAAARDQIWEHSLPPADKQAFLTMAQHGDFSGLPLPPANFVGIEA